MNPDELARAFGIEPYRDPASNITAIPQPPQKTMAIFSKVNAHVYVDVIKPHVGEWLVLYGGGGSGSHIVRLLSVKPELIDFYGPNNEVFHREDDWRVRVVLQPSPQDSKYSPFREATHSAYIDKAGKYHGPIYGKRNFEPCLGSWRLGTF